MPSTSIRDRAEARFAAIRDDARRQLAAGEVEPIPVPRGHCGTSIARVETNAPELLEPIAAVQRALGELGPTMAYPAESLHISLLGLTQRHEVLDPSPERSERLVELVRRATAGAGPATVEVGRLNLLGSQWFLEIIPETSGWAGLRVEVGAAAIAGGEDPMVHPDPEPMHLNIARITGPIDTVAAIDALDRLTIGARATLSTIEVAITDFVVSPEDMKALGGVRLKG